ncbi:hypothetical protein A2619_03455 [candidate division WWE3 bacterium RIFOXYD1_FULL_39_9]|uniref:Uncharacterized protein n=1 Tax=candidate division WWE3 bacterium RIFOXYD1_FULL_39_9 TaxID=1802649 RepID=A0A1F4X5T2_UNCKA|nr:MAG: hypothetical protein A2619_03455 [candidate division WWE3 bacterium RIFOXYD1_FULL_39_9]
MNGCYRTQREIEEGICTCLQYEQATGRCLSKIDTVSKIDGQSTCPRNPLAIPYKEWEKRK